MAEPVLRVQRATANSSGSSVVGVVQTANGAIAPGSPMIIKTTGMAQFKLEPRLRQIHLPAPHHGKRVSVSTNLTFLWTATSDYTSALCRPADSMYSKLW